MSYTDGMAAVLARISQIQAGFSSVPTPSAVGAGDFETVMAQISSVPGLAQGGQSYSGSSGTGVADLSGSYGWPLEDGTLTKAELAALGNTGVIGADSAYATPTVDGPSSASGSSAAQGAQAVLASSQWPTSEAAPGASWGNAIVADAQKYLGVPYQWGGTDPTTGVDCSGLVQDVFNDLGVSLPRTADEQSMTGTAVASLQDAQPGDLIFFAGSDGTPTDPGHVGIYIGNGQMIDAPHTGTDVRVEDVSSAGPPTAIRRISAPVPASGTVSLDGSPTSGTASPYGLSAPGTASLGGLSASGAASLYGTGMTTSSLSPLESTIAGTVNPADDGASSADEGTALAGATAVSATPSASPYTSDFAQAAATYGVPQQLLAAVAQTESSFDPYAVSSAGAEGLMQLMPNTASSIGVNPFQPSQAIEGAASLLASYHQQFGSWALAVAAYNAGPNAVQQYSGVPPYAETQAYVQNVLSRAGMELE